MHSPRAQADKRAYQAALKRIVEEQPNLALRQETVEELLSESVPASSGPRRYRVVGVRVRGDATYGAPIVILTTGTFMAARMHTGEAQIEGGRAGEGTSPGVSRALLEGEQGARIQDAGFRGL